MSRQGVAGEEGLHPAFADQLGDVLRRPRMHDRRTADEQHLLPLGPVFRIESATACKLTAFGFSLETLEPMKPNGVDFRDRSSGITRMPACPTIDRHPERDVGHRARTGQSWPRCR